MIRSQTAVGRQRSIHRQRGIEEEPIDKEELKKNLEVISLTNLSSNLKDLQTFSQEKQREVLVDRRSEAARRSCGMTFSLQRKELPHHLELVVDVLGEPRASQQFGAV